MSYRKPYINPGAPVKIGLDGPIEEIRTAMATFAWINYSFGRAFVFKEKDLVTEKLLRTPKVYEKKGEYINVLPNDNLFADGSVTSFIVKKGAESYESYQPHSGSIKKADLAVIIWGNLKKIDPTKDYIFIEELKKDIEIKLKQLSAVDAITKWVDEKAEDVFEGFDFPVDMNTQYLMHPYTGFRIELMVKYPEAC